MNFTLECHTFVRLHVCKEGICNLLADFRESRTFCCAREGRANATKTRDTRNSGSRLDGFSLHVLSILEYYPIDI